MLPLITHIVCEKDRQEIVLATSDGGVHVLSIEVNPEADEEKKEDGKDVANDSGGDGEGCRGTLGKNPLGEDAFSDMYSSSSADRSRVSTATAAEELAAEQAAHWLVRAASAVSEFSSSVCLSICSSVCLFGCLFCLSG